MLALPDGPPLLRAVSAEPRASIPAAENRSHEIAARGRKAARPVPRCHPRGARSSLRKRGFNRLYQAGRVFEFSTPEDLLDVDFAKPVYVLVDRLALAPEIRSRLMDSIEICYREGHGEAILEFRAGRSPGDASPERHGLSTSASSARNAAPLYQEPEPRLFSFNNPYGACPRCQGFGNTIDFDLDRVIPDKGKSLNEGAIEPWTKPRYRQLAAGSEALRPRERHSRSTCLSASSPPRSANAIIEGDQARIFPA